MKFLTKEEIKELAQEFANQNELEVSISDFQVIYWQINKNFYLNNLTAKELYDFFKKIQKDLDFLPKYIKDLKSTLLEDKIYIIESGSDTTKVRFSKRDNLTLTFSDKEVILEREHSLRDFIKELDYHYYSNLNEVLFTLTKKIPIPQTLEELVDEINKIEYPSINKFKEIK